MTATTLGDVRPAPDESAKILQLLFADGDLIEICALSESAPVESLPLIVGPGMMQEIAAWAGPRNTAGRNIYFLVNPLKPWQGSRPHRTDLRAVTNLFADYDPQFGTDSKTVAPWNRVGPPASLEEEQARIATFLQAGAGLPNMPPPAAVVHTGGGFQCFWKLSDPADNVDAAEAVQRHLCLITGGDRHASRALQLARLPGWINWPSAKKAARGRMPALARLLHTSSTTCNLAAFPEPVQVPRVAARPGEHTISVEMHEVPEILDDWDIKARCDRELPRQVWEYLTEPGTQYNGKDYPSRSEAEFSCLVRMMASGADPAMVVALLTDERHPISKRSHERSGNGTAERRHEYALVQVNNAWEAAQRHPRVLQFSERYAPVKDYLGKYRIVEFTGHAERPYRPIDPKEFERSHVYTSVQVGETASGNPKLANAATEWLRVTKPYERAEFLPGRDAPEGTLNLWAGWPADLLDSSRARGSYALFAEHVRQNICAGDEAAAQYLWGWMAHMVQHPDEPGQVAVVLRSTERGTGKTKVFEVLQRIIGVPYTLTASKTEQIVGRFNDHMQHTILMCAEEAFFAGSKANQGVLNDLITSDRLTVEGKGLGVVSVRNCLHLLVISNNEWVVPAGPDERRYLVLDVAPHRRRDYEFFAAMDSEMESGGYAALLQDLLAADLSGFNVREPPNTAALWHQKERSMPSLHRWLYEALAAGELAGVVIDERAVWPSDVLLRDLCEYFRRHERYEAVPSRSVVGKLWQSVGGERKRVRRQALRDAVSGMVAASVGAEAGDARGGPARLAPSHPAWVDWEQIAGAIPWVYTLGDLAAARDMFQTKYQTNSAWGEDEQARE